MRRTRLIWFAIGAGTSLTATVMSMMFFASPEPLPTVPYLELTEPFVLRGEGEDLRNEDMIANLTGEVTRNCGAEFFETTFLYEDHSPTVEIAVVPENADAIDCIVTAASQRSIQTNIIFRKADNAQTH